MTATGPPASSPTARLERVLRAADDLAGSLGARARRSTTPAQERALLRLFGVAGLDRAGVPLAAAVMERVAAGGTDRLAAGVTLPFAVALLEYDLTPQQLALDVASGAVDLALEAELLADPARRAAAEAEAQRVAAAALERIDTNRVARLDLLDVLGDAPRPWLGLSLASSTLLAAPPEAQLLARAGADLLRVRVPAIRELVVRLQDRGLEPGYWLARDSAPASSDREDPAGIPAGSQRALAVLREQVDEAAAEVGRYVRLATSAPALAAPEQALVAGLERVDIVEADAVAEIVTDGVDPDRALADHAFSHRILGRSGAVLAIGPGPLTVAPDLARGLPADSATRAGRAFALQALTVAVARGNGLTGGQVAAGALVPWLAEERQPAVHALAAVAIRRLAWPGIGLVLEEPETSGRTGARWPYLVSLALGIGGPGAIVVRRAVGAAAAAHVEETTRAAASLAAEVAEPAEAVLARPAVGALAASVLEAAEATLAALAADGWSAVLGEPLGGADLERLGADAVVERSESFDPLADRAGR